MKFIVQSYNYAYELQMQTSIDLMGNLFTGMKICMDNKFLIGSHTDGILTVLNLETETSQTMTSIFGEVDNIWGIELLANPCPGEPQMLMIPTSSGMYQCILTQLGQLLYCMESFFEGSNVTNVVVVN